MHNIWIYEVLSEYQYSFERGFSLRGQTSELITSDMREISGPTESVSVNEPGVLTRTWRRWSANEKWWGGGGQSTVSMQYTFKLRERQFHFQNPTSYRCTKSSPAWGHLFEDQMVLFGKRQPFILISMQAYLPKDIFLLIN